ncbi:BCCT family transporter, partial [Stenotrophomonas maltophilia]
IEVSSSKEITPSTTVFEGGPIVQTVKKDNTLAVFALFDAIDGGLLGTLLSITTCILLITYLVTSQDSGT